MDYSPTIRQAQEKDLADLATLDEMIFCHLAYPYFVLRQIFDVHHGELLVLEQAGGLRGYSIAVRSTTRGLAWFLGLGVEPGPRVWPAPRRCLAGSATRPGPRPRQAHRRRRERCCGAALPPSGLRPAG